MLHIKIVEYQHVDQTVVDCDMTVAFDVSISAERVIHEVLSASCVLCDVD